MVPFIARMDCLRFHRKVEVPESEEFKNWNTWTKNVLGKETVNGTLGIMEKVNKSMEAYANGTKRNGRYFKTFGGTY